MGGLFGYLVKVNMVLAVLVVVYHFLLRKEKLLGLNRCLLMGMAVIGFGLPFVPVFPAVVFGGFVDHPGGRLADRLGTLLGVGGGHRVAGDAGGGGMAVMTIFLCVYGLGLLLQLGRLCVQLLRIGAVIAGSRRERVGGIVVCRPRADVGPMSFFRYVIIKEDSLGPEAYAQVLSHERVHGSGLHSIDVLLSELVCVVLWMNPLAYLYRRQVKLNLEFLADEGVLRKGFGRRDYQLNLLRHVTEGQVLRLGSMFHSSQVKRRISMMNTGRPGFWHCCKYVLLVPALLVMHVFLNPAGVRASASMTGDAQRKISIDARTEVVKVRWSAEKAGAGSLYNGIYVIEGHVYSDRDLREALAVDTALNIVLSKRPVLAYFPPGDAGAAKRWGPAGNDGVIFVDTRGL